MKTIGALTLLLAVAARAWAQEPPSLPDPEVYDLDAAVAKMASSKFLDQYNCAEGFAVVDEATWKLANYEDKAWMTGALAQYCKKPGHAVRMVMKSDRTRKPLGHWDTKGFGLDD
jgi:hypothetical protein